MVWCPTEIRMKGCQLSPPTCCQKCAQWQISLYPGRPGSCERLRGGRLTQPAEPSSLQHPPGRVSFCVSRSPKGRGNDTWPPYPQASEQENPGVAPTATNCQSNRERVAAVRKHAGEQPWRVATIIRRRVPEAQPHCCVAQAQRPHQ